MNALRIYTQNTRGLNSKIKTGTIHKTTLLNHDIFALTETWLQSNVSSTELFNETYVTHRSDRILSDEVQTGGGVLVAIKNNIVANRLTAWEQEIPFENIWLKIQTNDSTKIYLNTIYLKSGFNSAHLKQYLDHITDIMLNREPYSKFIILGDFNMSNIEWFRSGKCFTAIDFDGFSASNLLDTLTCTDLSQFNGIKNSFNRILDLVLSNVELTVVRANEIITNEDDYHPSLIVTVHSANVKFMKVKKGRKLNYRKADYVSINTEIEQINWTEILNDQNIDIASENFYYIIMNIINKFVPLTKRGVDNYPLWFSPILINVINDKSHYRNLWKSTNNTTYKTLFEIKRKESKKLKQYLYYKYINNVESSIKSNPKCFFAYTKSLKQSNKLPNTMFLRENVSDSIEDTCNLFAEHFSSVYTQTANAPTITCNNNCNNYFHISRIEIAKLIESFDGNKANSPDLIPMIFYINTSKTISIPLEIIFNKAITSMTFPSKWKHSLISPIFKAGDKANIENYRPISIISAISKIFEKGIYLHIHNQTCNQISDMQHGFTTGKSTLSNLLEYNNYLAKNMVKGNQVDTIFTDMTKAFDRIDHSLLLEKLKRYDLEICLIKLIESFLRNRTQTVCVYGAKSQAINPLSSVPQGSILSPLLFALFINDLPNRISSNLLMYADDVKIFRKITNMHEAQLLQNDINSLKEWCNENKLNLNTSKCYVMSTTRKTHHNIHLFNYKIDNTPLMRVSTYKDLGVIFDSKLTFKEHINSIITKSFKILGFISRSLNRFRRIETYKTLYFTYVRGVLEYCSPVWTPHYDIHIYRIEKIQKCFTRKVFYKFHFPYEQYEMRLLRLNMLSLYNRRLLTDELTFYKIFNHIIKSSLANDVMIRNPQWALRGRNLFYLPFVTTNIEFHSAILRMQRRHDDTFADINLNIDYLNFKKLASDEVKSHQVAQY